MLRWIRKSFFRQVMSLLAIGGLVITASYGYFDYTKERDQLREILQADALHLAHTLSLVIADDILYHKYFELWSRLDAVYAHQSAGEDSGLLYRIREIAVTDNDGLILGHTNPRENPLLRPDADNPFPLGEERPAQHELRWWVSAGSPLLAVRQPVFHSNERVGDITLVLDPSPLVVMQRQMAIDYLMYELLFLAILMFSAHVLARRLARPLEQFGRALPAMGTGEVDLSTLRRREDELGRLASAIEDADRRIHEARRSERDRRQELEDRVHERTREIESFTYSVSHDLRSPLRAMDGFSQALLEDHADDLDAEARDYLQRIRAAAARMGEIIDDLLLLSRISRQSLSREDVDLSRLSRMVVDGLRERHPDRDVEVNIEEGLHVKGDRRLLRILLENLLGNAWKYTGKCERARIDFGRTHVQGREVFVVRDNGAGFDMKYVDKLFDAFQRLHGRDEYEGTGIGLTIVHRIVERHQGRIWAEGTPGEGAAFYFHLAGSDASGDGESPRDGA